MGFHSVVGIGARHPAVSWEYADATARTSASGFASTDLGGLAWQQDDNTIWLLTSTSPTWVAVGGSSSGSTDRIHLNVRKGSPGTINHGQPCYLSGYNVSGWIEVELADADVTASMPAIGLANGSITNSATGDLITYGTLEDTDTSSWSVQDSLFVSTTVGELTSTKPTGATTLIQKVGTVLRSHGSQGVILVSGANRSNDLPNVAEGYTWVGDSNGQPEETPFDIASIGAGTLAQLNTVISDANVDDDGDPRPPLIASDAHGDIIVRGTAAWVRLPAGTSGQILQTNGAAADPSWVAKPAAGDVVGPASAVDNALVRFDTTTGKLIQSSAVTMNDDGDIDMNDQAITELQTATFNSVPTITPSGGTLTAEFDVYQKIIASLNNVATVTLQLNVPNGPGNFMIELIQGSSTPTTTLTWSTEGTHALYAPGGSVDVQTGAGEITLIGLFYDGSTWFVTPSAMTQVIAT